MRIVMFAAVFFVGGCTSSGHYEWQNVTTGKSQQEFNVDRAQCNMAAIEKVKIPGASCTAVAKPDCPAGMAGAACNYTNASSPDQKCDYTAVNIATQSQEDYRVSCLQVKGWNNLWIPNPTP